MAELVQVRSRKEMLSFPFLNSTEGQEAPELHTPGPANLIMHIQMDMQSKSNLKTETNHFQPDLEIQKENDNSERVHYMQPVFP